MDVNKDDELNAIDLNLFRRDAHRSLRTYEVRLRYICEAPPRMEDDFAGLRVPHPGMRGIGICGALPHTPTEGKGIYARLRLALRLCGNYIWGFAPCPT